MAGRKPPLCVDVLVNDKPVCLELDTGAALSVCSEQEYRRIWPVDGPVIHSCDKVLKTYSGETLPVVGEAQVQVRYGSQVADLSVIVLKGSGPFLFGRDWLAKLKLDWPAICRVSTDASMDELVTEFAGAGALLGRACEHRG